MESEQDFINRKLGIKTPIWNTYVKLLYSDLVSLLKEYAGKNNYNPLQQPRNSRFDSEDEAFPPTARNETGSVPNDM